MADLHVGSTGIYDNICYMGLWVGVLFCHEGFETSTTISDGNM